MANNEESINLNLNSTKSAARPSHESLETHTGDATDAAKSSEEQMDRVAMEGAKRAQNRIHADEQRNPEDTIFTK